MKTPVQLVTALAVLFCGQIRGKAQGTFINLNFELAQIVTIPGSPDFPYDVVRSSALPGWTTYNHYLGTNMIWHNTLSLGSPAISIHDNAGFAPVMQGQYRIGLQPGLNLVTAIGQVGTIPVNSLSVRWYQSSSEFWGPSLVSFAGQALSVFRISDATGYSIYGANLAGLGGATGELVFHSQIGGGASPVLWLDNIFFSTQPVPEPTIYALATLGLAFFLMRRRIGR